jgi:hypothetical protein
MHLKREKININLLECKDLDDIIFSVFGLTEEERKEAYRSMAELGKINLIKQRVYKYG